MLIDCCELRNLSAAAVVVFRNMAVQCSVEVNINKRANSVLLSAMQAATKLHDVETVAHTVAGVVALTGIRGRVLLERPGAEQILVAAYNTCNSVLQEDAYSDEQETLRLVAIEHLSLLATG